MKKYLFLSKKLQFEREKSNRRCGARAEGKLFALCRAAKRKHHPCGGVKRKEERAKILCHSEGNQLAKATTTADEFSHP